jgi:hypothetical protein
MKLSRISQFGITTVVALAARSELTLRTNGGVDIDAPPFNSQFAIAWNERSTGGPSQSCSTH